MNEKLRISYFGPIKKAELDIKRFTVLIGSQASGKSTIAKLLAIFRNVSFYTKEKVTNEAYSVFFQKYNLNEYFHNGKTVIEYENDNYSIKYQNKEWTVIKNEAFQNKIKSEKQRITDFLIGFVESNERYSKQTKSEKEALIEQLFVANFDNLVSYKRNEVYIPAERILLSIIFNSTFSLLSGKNELSLSQSFKDFGLKFQLARNRVKEFSIDFLKINYKFIEGEMSQRIYFDSEHSISLSDSSSGIQTLLPLMLVVEDLVRTENNDEYSFIVEEPELNLFPTAQDGVINFLISKCNFGVFSNPSPANSEVDKKHDLVITTHSPYILSILNNLLFAYQVSQKHPTKKKEIREIISEDKWINPDEFNAYYINEGSVNQIYDPKTQVISENELDNISINLTGDFDSLMEIYTGN